MLRWKMLAAMTMIGTALSIGAGGTFLAPTVAQEPVTPKPQSNGTTLNPVTNQPVDENSKHVLRAYMGQNQPPVHVPQWDYRVVTLKSDPQAELLALGKEGWELVTVETKTGMTAFLKRPLLAAPVATITTPSVTPGREELNFTDLFQQRLRTTPEAELKSKILDPNASNLNVDLMTFRLKRLKATTVATVLSELFGKETGLVGAQPEPNTNSVLVTGTPERIAAIKKLIEQLDSEPMRVSPSK